MKASELRDKSATELRDQIHKNNVDLFELRSKAAIGQATNPRLMRTLKKDIARCHTLITEGERAGGAGK